MPEEPRSCRECGNVQVIQFAEDEPVARCYSVECNRRPREFLSLSKRNAQSEEKP